MLTDMKKWIFSDVIKLRILRREDYTVFPGGPPKITRVLFRERGGCDVKSKGKHPLESVKVKE